MVNWIHWWSILCIKKRRTCHYSLWPLTKYPEFTRSVSIPIMSSYCECQSHSYVWFTLSVRLVELDQLCGITLLCSAHLRWLRHAREIEMAFARTKEVEVHQPGTELRAFNIFLKEENIALICLNGFNSLRKFSTVLSLRFGSMKSTMSFLHLTRRVTVWLAMTCCG